MLQQLNSYKHGVISPLINPDLLRSVRTEIQTHLSFTEKETDIYKIFQSGDLANLDGLDDSSLSRLPSLLQLRDALYSGPFREYLSEITGAGKLSGRKTDMAINVYNEGCHLLCHDDVIGSRRVSYILYLTDPDTPWQASWGGALRLYPTKTERDKEGKEVKIPAPDYTVAIPPAFNQLSFFAVQPGESFHDVEEVYHAEEGLDEKQRKARVRMAISGWFHVPQEGEDGYEEGLEEKLAERSSLAQLQGQGDEFDRPKSQIGYYGDDDDKDKDKTANEFTEEDLDFLLKYITPSYLTPDFTEQLSETFSDESSLSLERILCDKFSARVRSYIEGQGKLPGSSDEIEQRTEWRVSRPPHKHRYLYQERGREEKEPNTPIQELLQELLPSRAFRKWLSVVTGLDDLGGQGAMARRFRRGEDYTLASGYDGDQPRIEYTIGLTPSAGWEKQDDEEGEEEGTGAGKETKENGKGQAEEERSVGGYEIYMAGDDDEDDDDEGEGEGGQDGGEALGSTGTKSKVNKKKADPAIYRSAEGEDEDDGILFSMAAGWNRMSIVMRDRGTLKFVKYVSRAAGGDRWDISGEVEVNFEE